MFYLGYCDMCNYLDADLNGNDLFDILQEHQQEKHKTIDTDFIHTFRVSMSFGVWLKVRRSPKFWEAWRNRNKPEIAQAYIAYVERFSRKA